jgi:hypothetical protein
MFLYTHSQHSLGNKIQTIFGKGPKTVLQDGIVEQWRSSPGTQSLNNNEHNLSFQHL